MSASHGEEHGNVHKHTLIETIVVPVGACPFVFDISRRNRGD